MAHAVLPSGLVTFLFTDIEGSTRLSARAGDRFGALIDRHHAIIRAALQRHGGVEVSTEGDAFFAVFTSPTQAAACVVETQRALAAEEWPRGLPIRVRMGLHTGEGRLGGDSYAGYDVNLAARVGAAGHGGQVVLSEATWSVIAQDLPDGVGGIALGQHHLKDIEGPVQLYQLVIDGLPGEFPALKAGRPGNLPVMATTFIGREQELAEVARLMERARLVTLIGPGGAGKTRVAIEAARRAADGLSGGAWFVALEGLSDDDLVLPAIASTLGIAERAGISVERAIASSIGETPQLVVLDNAEHVLGAAPGVGRLIEEAPGLRVLATSREPLRVAGEQSYPLPVLPLRTGVALFAERARLVLPSFEVADDRATVEQLVKRLDVLPLAIELAAARIRMFAPNVLLERLDDRLSLLGQRTTGVPERQRTLRGTIEWSYELLSATEQSALAGLSVFAGGFDLDAAERVLGGSQVLEDTESLLDRSLLLAEPLTGGQRYRMLESIRHFAADVLAGAPERQERLREAHADHYAQIAPEIGARVRDGDESMALAVTDAEHDNMRAAIDWSLAHDVPAPGMRIAASMWRAWMHRSHLTESRQQLERLLAHPRAGDEPVVQGQALLALGGVCFWLGDLDAAHRLYLEAADVAQAAEDRHGRASALLDLSYTLTARGEPPAAADALAEALEVFVALGDRDQAHRARGALVNVRVKAGDLDTAAGEIEVLLDEARATGRDWQVVDRLGMAVVVAVLRGDAAMARGHLREMRGRRIAISDARMSSALEIGAMVALAEGDPRWAARWLGTLQRIRDDGEGVTVASEFMGISSPEPETREQLADDFDVYFEAGRTLTLDAAAAEIFQDPAERGDPAALSSVGPDPALDEHLRDVRG